MHVGLVLSAHARNKYYELVKVVNNAGGIILLYLAAIQNVYLPSLDLVQREKVCGFLADITSSPIYLKDTFVCGY